MHSRSNASSALHREGARVVFTPNPASYALYSHAPDVGARGTVTSVPLGGRRATHLAGPGGGLIYVAWDDGSFQGVSSIDLTLASKIKKNPGRKASRRPTQTWEEAMTAWSSPKPKKARKARRRTPKTFEEASAGWSMSKPRKKPRKKATKSFASAISGWSMSPKPRKKAKSRKATGPKPPRSAKQIAQTKALNALNKRRGGAVHMGSLPANLQSEMAMVLNRGHKPSRRRPRGVSGVPRFAF
jgi:hypothetical protein